MAPAARSIPTLQASKAAGPAVKAGAPKPVGMSATSMMSLMPMGTPASAPAACMAGSSSSSLLADMTWLHASTPASSRSMAARLWRAASVGPASPDLAR
ncbi:hypothetical protein D3C72_2031370 [compost metagenome]